MSRILQATRRILLALSLVAWWSSDVAAQPPSACATARCESGWPEVASIAQLRREFAASVRQFALGLSDVSHDRRAAQSNIESMARALDRWDGAIREFETALRLQGQVEGRVALGRVYLERHRLDEALSELGNAAREHPSRADIHVLMSTAYRHANRRSDAARALATASGLDTRDSGTLYEMARALTKVGLGNEAEAARARFRAALEQKLTQTPPNGVTSNTLEMPGPSLPFEGAAPVFPPSLYAAGFALLARGAYADAIVSFREALATDGLSADSEDAPDALAKGRAAMRQGDLPSALTLLESAVAARPERAESHRVLGAAYVIDGQGGRGLEQFKAAIRLDPQDERAWMGLADLLATVGQFPEAEQVLKGALQVIAGSGQAHFGLGRLYRVQGRYVDAARELQAAAMVGSPIGRDALHEMLEETYVALAAFDRAAEIDIARIDANPNSVHAHRRLGDAYLRQDREDEALTEFAAIVAIDFRDSAAYGSMAQIYLRTGRYAEAAAASTRALELDPSRKEAHYSLGTALMRLGRTDEGVSHLDEYQRLQVEATAIGRRQHELERLKRDASVAIANADFEKAASLLRRSVEYESAAATLLALGFALMQTGRHAEAIVELQKASRLEDDPNVHRYLAEAYRAAGRADESRAEARVYLEMMERAKKERLRRMSGTP